MSFTYARTVRLADTDAAGVVYFAQILAICHEAYEAYLEQAGVEISTLAGSFSIAIPIIRTSAEFLQPLRWGDRLLVRASLQDLRDRSFELGYEISLAANPQALCAQAQTRHICIALNSRTKVAVPGAIARILRALNADDPQ